MSGPNGDVLRGPTDSGPKPGEGICATCRAIVPPARILPGEAGVEPRHMTAVPGKPGTLCGPVFVKWFYHFAFHWKVAPGMEGYMDRLVTMSRPLDQPESLELARQFLAQQVKPHDPQATAVELIGISKAVTVTILSWQFFGAK